MGISKLEQRAKIINYLYSFELFDKSIDSVAAFESGDFDDREIKIIENIAKNYDKFKANIIKIIKVKWSWERIAPYLRAILIFGSFDFLINPKNLVINELVVLTKAYAPDDSYKFINGILNTMGDYYEKIKK